jgi:type IV secretory pathway VirB6-like protein
VPRLNQKNQNEKKIFIKIFKMIFFDRIFAGKAFILLAFLTIFSSCSDQGCIDAADFGEYESQTLTVTANNAQGNCDYDPSLSLSDAGQGSGLKACLGSSPGSCLTLISNTGIVNLSDNGTPALTQQIPDNGGGCNSALLDGKQTLRTICINQVKQACLTNSGVGSLGAEPSWKSTDAKESQKNSGVTIRPGSEISIRAVGSVNLGDSFSYPSIFVKADSPYSNSQQSNWSQNFFDVRNGQTADVKFSGKWSDASGTFGAGAGATDNSDTFNGARRLVAFFIPAPAGYDFNTSAANEKSGSKGVTLLPDPSAWQCDYDTAVASSTQVSCSNKDYSSIGYTGGISNSLVNSTFPISSAFQTTTLTKYGGIIRWDIDGISSESGFDPYMSVSCDNNGNCPGSDAVSPNQGKILGDISSATSTLNTYPDSYKVSFKSLNVGCTPTLSVNVNNGTSDLSSPIAIPVTGTWSSQHITLNPNHRLQIQANNAKVSGADTNCGKVIAVRFTKYHKLQMQQSGFVRFTMLGGTGASGTCTIKARIVNPNGSSVDNAATGLRADFYEYDDFTTALSRDPLSNLVVSASNSTSQNWTSLSNGNSIFVRKGQTILFSPESWNGSWTAKSPVSRNCGIGMAMQIIPRPAIVCKGTGSGTIMNASCSQDYNSGGTLIGCKTDVASCNTSGGSSYCPVSCRQRISCATNGNVANNYAKTGCAALRSPLGQLLLGLPSTSDPLSAATTTCTYAAGFSSTTCNNCAAAMISAGHNSAMVNLPSLSQCFDLENYSGKVDNIPTTGFNEGHLANASISKGATKLGAFNGQYGNFENFSDTGKSETTTPTNKILQLKSPLTFSSNGRLQFFVVDGVLQTPETDYSGNSASGASYNGNNGFKIVTSSLQQFTNGQWLQARLCKESSDSSSDCKSSNPTPLSEQPTIITIAPPVVAGQSPDLTGSNYIFDSYGTLVRTTGPIAGDCTVAAQGVDGATANAPFYCHTYNYYTANALKTGKMADGTVINTSDINANTAKLRLTFKIIDPEASTCNISNPADAVAANFNGVKLNNALYDSNIAANTNAICGVNEVPSTTPESPKTTCTKQFYCANKYTNNSGQYYVKVQVKNTVDGTASNIIGQVITPIVEVMDGTRDSSGNSTSVGQAERMYKLLIQDSRYQFTLTMLLVMMFTFYGFGYLMGISEANITETLNRVVKIGLIYFFVGDTGWYWFNKIVVQFFKGGTDYLAFMMASSFDESPEVAKAISSNDFYNKAILFSSVDKVFGMFFSAAVQKKASALLFASIFGWAYLAIIYFSFMLYVYAVANAVLIYLTAQVFLSILFTLGPIFFVFTLFQTTKGMFDNWLKQLIGFSLQQIFLLTTLAFFNMLMYEVIKMSLGYRVCWDEVWTINILITRITLLSFWTVASLPPRTSPQTEVGNIGNPDGIPSLFSILFIWVIASLMLKFVTFMTDIASSIGGGISATKLSEGVKEAASKMKKSIGDSDLAKQVKGLASNVAQRIDQKLFDSGALADSARAKQKNENIQNRNLRSQLNKGGQEAVKDFKKNHADQLVGKSQAEQQKILDAEFKSGQMRRGDALGLSEGKVNQLLNDKTFKSSSNSFSGAALEFFNERARSGGVLKPDEKASTHFSNSEAKAAMGKMDPEERKKFLGAMKRGEITADKSFGVRGTLGAKSIANTAGQAWSGTKAVGASIADTLHNKIGLGISEETVARQQLEAEGAITRMAGENTPGLRAIIASTRTDADKKLIRDRVKENATKKKQTADALRVAEPAALAEFQNLDEAMTRDEAIDSSESSFKGARKLAARLNPAKIKNPFARGAKKASIEGALERIGDDIKSIEGDPAHPEKGPGKLAEAKKSKAAAIAKRDDIAREKPTTTKAKKDQASRLADANRAVVLEDRNERDLVSRAIGLKARESELGGKLAKITATEAAKAPKAAAATPTSPSNVTAGATAPAPEAATSTPPPSDAAPSDAAPSPEGAARPGAPVNNGAPASEGATGTPTPPSGANGTPTPPSDRATPVPGSAAGAASAIARPEESLAPLAPSQAAAAESLPNRAGPPTPTGPIETAVPEAAPLAPQPIAPTEPAGTERPSIASEERDDSVNSPRTLTPPTGSIGANDVFAEFDAPPASPPTVAQGSPKPDSTT